ncbi:hypothetical protein Pmani_029014 [Petrolisthes manimaculis]|uniref:Enoyl reductase (ER) domain-containing protein n=1 Tax=Petrolisthes manimaculis TaxID=1843537 RepID=A0AAE1NYF2_9EUCA|nr:hypothetical protein Pmani_029014 [Petrolisthes manimaculis]
MSTMRGVLVRKFGGVEALKVESNVPVPSVAANQVLVKMKMSGVNPVDTYIRSGQYGKLPELPYIPGKDGAGLVQQIGKGVTKFKPGDRVFCNGSGTLAEYTTFDESHVFHLPDSYTMEEGASIGVPYFTAYRALFQKANIKSGERLLVHGASGAVGLAAVQMAKAYGLEVVGTAGTKEGLELVKRVGAHTVFNHRQSGYLDQLAAEPKFDVILEMLANVNLGADLPLMKARGRTVIVGSRGTVTINPRDLMITEACVMGVALLAAQDDEWDEIGNGVVKAIKEGYVKPVIDKVYPLDKVGDAHHDIIQSSGAKGNLVVQVQE